ncbi:MAG TPA: GNAT family N-acetyltransferase [Anaerolineales bacterium]|nr:GNAT family N-acetyltransferase [Anaerolineales bacterium]HLO29537.1 GNAT family N-acetyltransferase [Anaerolineales bacterium]
MLIEKISEGTHELHEALQRLIPQLGSHKIPPTWDEMDELIKSESSMLLAAREPEQNGPIVGILSLTIYRVPTGLRAIIEDVIVDKTMRRRGIGEALVRSAIDLAREAGASGVSLTSNPQREAANGLYQSMGFELRKTNPYFYKLK